MSIEKDEFNDGPMTPTAASPIDAPPAHESNDQVEEPRRVFALDPFNRASDYEWASVLPKAAAHVGRCFHLTSARLRP